MASAEEARQVEAHLPGCESCRESLAWMQATRRALSGRPVQSPPAGLHARIAEAIAASDAAPLRLRPARTSSLSFSTSFATRPAFAAAASLAAVGLFLGYSLTHLPRPAEPGKTVPSVHVAAVPPAPPTVSVAPEKHAAPAVRKPKSMPQVADNRTGNNDTLPAPAKTPGTAPAQRPSTRPERNTAMKTAPPPAALVPAPPLKPIAPRPGTGLVAVQPPVAAKHIPAAVPVKAPPMVAQGDVKGGVRTPDVHVLPPTITPQEPPAPEQTASVSADPPRVQTVDFIREVRAHLPSPRTFGQSPVGLSVRGVSAVTRTFGNDGGAQPLASIVHSSLGDAPGSTR